MPLIPEEPQIHESVPGPRPAAGGTRTPQTPRPVPVPIPVPGPRPAPRPVATRTGRTRPSPGRPSQARPAAGAAAVPAQARSAEAGVQIQLVTTREADAIAAADSAVDALLDAGRAPSDILVLTTGESHPWAQHELSFGEDSYWRQQDEGADVFYAGATAERAAKRPAVVLVVNGGSDAETARALPAAMSRAGSLLVVCGDPERLRTLL